MALPGTKPASIGIEQIRAHVGLPKGKKMSIRNLGRLKPKLPGGMPPAGKNASVNC